MSNVIDITARLKRKNTREPLVQEMIADVLDDTSAKTVWAVLHPDNTPQAMSPAKFRMHKSMMGKYCLRVKGPTLTDASDIIDPDYV